MGTRRPSRTDSEYVDIAPKVKLVDPVEELAPRHIGEIEINKGVVVTVIVPKPEEVRFKANWYAGGLLVYSAGRKYTIEADAAAKFRRMGILYG